MAVDIAAAQREAEAVFVQIGITRAQVRTTLSDFQAFAERSGRRGISADLFVPLVGYCMGAWLGSQQCSQDDRLQGFCILWKLLNYGCAVQGIDMDAMQEQMARELDQAGMT